MKNRKESKKTNRFILLLAFFHLHLINDQITFQLFNSQPSLPRPFLGFILKINQCFPILLIQHKFLLQFLTMRHKILTLHRQFLILLNEFLYRLSTQTRFILIEFKNQMTVIDYWRKKMKNRKRTLACSMSWSFSFNLLRSEAFWLRSNWSDSLAARSLISRVWEDIGSPKEWSMVCLMKSSISGGRDIVLLLRMKISGYWKTRIAENEKVKVKCKNFQIEKLEEPLVIFHTNRWVWFSKIIDKIDLNFNFN